MVKQPLHTFLSVQSYLLLEEHYDKEHAKTVAQHALVVMGGSRLPVHLLHLLVMAVLVARQPPNLRRLA